MGWGLAFTLIAWIILMRAPKLSVPLAMRYAGIFYQDACIKLYKGAELILGRALQLG